MDGRNDDGCSDKREEESTDMVAQPLLLLLLAVVTTTVSDGREPSVDARREDWRLLALW